MKFAWTLMFVLAASTALAAESLVIYQHPTKAAKGVADVVESSTVKGSTVTITTRLGNVIPVRQFSRLDAVILNAYLHGGFAVDVSGCRHWGPLVPNATEYDASCIHRTYEIRFACGLLDTNPTIEPGKWDARNYELRDVKAKPFLDEDTYCGPIMRD